MKRNALMSLSLGLLVVAGASVSAAEAKSCHNNNFRNINGRQFEQQERIIRGVSNGSLTGREARHLERREQRFAAQEARFRASGNGLSYAERQRLNHEQNVMSRSIHNQAHDGQFR